MDELIQAKYCNASMSYIINGVENSIEPIKIECPGGQCVTSLVSLLISCLYSEY